MGLGEGGGGKVSRRSFRRLGGCREEGKSSSEEPCLIRL